MLEEVRGCLYIALIYGKDSSYIVSVIGLQSIAIGLV
jgi:hypothetical protein